MRNLVLSLQAAICILTSCKRVKGSDLIMQLLGKLLKRRKHHYDEVVEYITPGVGTEDLGCGIICIEEVMGAYSAANNFPTVLRFKNRV